MVTALLILVFVVLVGLCGVMGYAAMNGCFVSQLWWMTGGFKAVVEVIGVLFSAIAESFSS